MTFMQRYFNWPDLEHQVGKQRFIPMKTFSKQWAGTDSKECYNENLKIQPEDWYYRNHEVRYALNSDGYRTQEFKDIDWKESVVIFGCSMVFGIGVDEEDTISANLSKIINRPVINMGVGGSSVHLALHNSLILNEFYPDPMAIIHLWTDYDRCTYYKPEKAIHYGSWNAEENNFMDNWNLHESNARMQALFTNMAARQIWQDRVPFYQATFFKRPAKLFKVPHFKGHLSRKDYARDLMHPGRLATKRAAERLAEMMNL